MASPPTNSTPAPIAASIGAMSVGMPFQTRRERVESHEFLEAALNEDATDQDASEQADGVVPCGAEPVRSRADPNQPRLWDRPELAGVRRSSRAPPFRPIKSFSALC